MSRMYTAKQIAATLNVTDRAVRNWAAEASWPIAGTKPGRGGGKLFDLSTLPKDIQTKIRLAEAKENDATPMRVFGQTQSVPLDSTRRRKAVAKLDMVGLYLDWLVQHGKSAKSRESFLTAYRAGTWPELLAVIGPKVSWKSIERWKVASRKEGALAAVADKRGLARRGRRCLNEEQKQTLIRFALQQGQPTISAVYREANKALAFEGQEPINSEATARRFLIQDWMREHFGDWTYVREGAKAWNDKCAFFIERDYDLIEVGDIVVADGHKLNFEIINPWTGTAQRMELVLWYDMKSNMPLGWDIMPSENTQSIAAALRRACLVLGMIPKVPYLDNGRAFRSKYFNGVDMRQTGLGGLFRSLGMQPLFAWPYHGQSKTVEGFFGTFAELERWVPSYSGTSIATKPARMKRGEWVHRDIYAKSGARPLTLLEANYAIALFFDEYSQRPQPKGHLRGRSPWEVFSEGRGPGLEEQQLLQLRELMLHTEQRTLRRNGVSLFGRNYYAPELYNRKHPVLVKYDPQELDDQGEVAWVLVYDEHGRCLCRADKVRGIHPAARLLGDERHQQELVAAIELKKGQEKRTATVARTLLERVVLPETARRMELVTAALPDPQAPKEPAPLSKKTVQAIESVKAKALKAKADAPAYTPPAEKQDIYTELDKYEYLFGLSVRDGVPLREADREWMEIYESTEEYAEVAARRFDQLRALYARQQKQQEASAC